MKRPLVAVCTVTLALALASCGSDDAPEGSPASDSAPAASAGATIGGEYGGQLAAICKRKGKSVRRWFRRLEDEGAVTRPGTLQTVAWLAADELGRLIRALERTPAPDPESEAAVQRITEAMDELRETADSIADTTEQAALSGSPTQMQLQLEAAITRIETVPGKTQALVDAAEQAGVPTCGIFTADG